MKKFVLFIIALLFVTMSSWAQTPFNNSNYTYTKIWSSSDIHVRWSDYNETAGKITWRDGNSNGYVADFNPATAVISNIVQFSTGGVYESSFSTDGQSIFYQDASSTTSIVVTGGTVQAYKCYVYNIATATSSVVFDISTIPAATIEALTSYVGNEFGFYLSQGGTNNDLLMCFRGSDGGHMEIARYNITAKTFTNLTNSQQAEYDGQYFGTDNSKLLYWTESYPTHATRGIAILTSGGETVLSSVSEPQMYLGARWGKDQSHVFAVKGTGFSNTDLVQFTYSGGTWSVTPEDMTGVGWSSASGGIYPGASVGNGFLFGVRNATTNNGLWYAQYNTVWNANTGIGYPTIQAAVNAATNGDVINVSAGIYYEEVSVAGKNNITINGAGEGLTIIAPYRSYTSSNYGIFINNAHGIVIQNLTIDGFANVGLAAGVAHFNDGIHWDALGGNNCIITHITIKNIDRRGISVWPENVTNNEITYCTVDNVTGVSNGYGHAIKFNGSGKVEHCAISNVTGAILGNCDVTGGTLSIQDNVISGLTGLTTTPFDIGINFWCKQSNVITVKNNSITANVDDNTGIYVVRGGDGSEISYNTLNLTGHGGLGIETGWENTWGFPIHHNTITMGKGGAGIVITGSGSDADPMLVYNNTLSNTGSDDSFTNDYTGYSEREVGLLLSGHQYTSRTGDANYSFNGSIYNNTIDGFKDGIVLASQIYAAGGFKDVEIKLSDKNSITNFETAARYGYISNTAPYPFTEIASTDANYTQQDLTMNYWGSATPDFANIIDGKIGYCPYYTDIAMTGTGPVVIVRTGTGYCSIQAAINAAIAGDVITVAAGTYDEIVTVNKALTINGPNAGLDPNTGSRVSEAILVSSPQPAGTNQKTQWHILANNVVIDGFYFDGSLFGSAIAISNWENNASATSTLIQNLTVQNCLFQNYIRSVVSGGETYPTAISLSVNCQGQGLSSGHLITSNKFDNIYYVSSGGVYNPTLTTTAVSFGNNLNGTISHNVITNVNGGIYLENINTGSVTLEYNSIQSYMTGIRNHYWSATPAGTVNITSNIVTPVGSIPGFTVMQNTALQITSSVVGGTQSTVISGNTLTGNYMGLRLYNFNATSGYGSVAISNNAITGCTVSVAGNIASAIRIDGNNAPALDAVTITGNNLSNNSGQLGTGLGIRNQTSRSINATCNWYGTSVASEVASKISGPVTYIPYSIANGGACTGGPVQIWRADVLISGHATIQTAINAAIAGDVITVAAGTYPEAVTVNKANLTIQGAGAASTFITTTTTTPGITVSVNGTVIKNLGITNATQLIEGIRVSTTVTGLTVDHVNFTNIGNGTWVWNGGPWACGVHVMGSLTNLSITNCTFDALSATHTANGVYSDLNTTLTNFTVENCTFNLCWNGLFLQSNIAGLHAKGNTFGPQEITDMGACVAGIYIGDGPAPFSIDQVLIEENTFTSYGRGIYFCDYGTGGVIGDVEIKNNTFTNSIYSSGIRLMAYNGGAGSAFLKAP
jgi:hypothetical protein